MMTSAAVTFARIDLLEMYRTMGYSDAQLDAIRGADVINSGTLIGMTATIAVLFVAYMVYVKRFVRPAG